MKVEAAECKNWTRLLRNARKTGPFHLNSGLIYSKRPNISFAEHISLLASLILAGWSTTFVLKSEKCSVVVDRF